MKTLYAVAVSMVMPLVASLTSWAQITVPDLSPYATVTQKVGFNEVRIEYSRPSVRGRVIFDDLVPFGKIWRTGANASTKLSVKEELTVQENYKLSPGIYSIYTIPNKDEWTIVINKDAWLWGAEGYRESMDAIRFNVKPQQLKEQVETFTIQFANICSSCADVQLLWDYTKVSFRISTNVEEQVLAQIKTFTTNPEGKLAGEYYMAAKYYYDANRDMKQALEWTDKSLQYGPSAYWVMHLKAEIQAKLGDYKGAIETATTSRDMAKEKNDDSYVRMNDLEIAKWKDLKKKGTK
jgi:tetratricopeptide (TPR) repeat protein